MEGAVKVARWGNSLAVRLPQRVVEALGLQVGDHVDITAKAAGKLELSRDRRREEALARIRELSRPLPPDFKFDRNEIYDHGRNGFRPDGDEG
jgi:antitoxin MazE